MTSLVCVILFATFCAPPGGAQSPGTAPASAVTIVLPPRVVAGEQATLAILDGEGRLTPDVTVELAGGQEVKTDATGRAFFSAPRSGSVMLAKASSASAATLVDAAAPATAPKDIKVPSILSARDRFSICGASFRADADANHVALNGVSALVLAASPECLVALPGPTVKPGPAKISFEIAGVQWASATDIVALEVESPDPPLALEKNSGLKLHVRGSESPLDIIVENQAPDVLRFLRGDRQELRTSGGAANSVALEVRAIRSGDFSFHARLARIPDPETARRYLDAAEALAPAAARAAAKQVTRTVTLLAAERRARNPRAIAKARRELDKLLASARPGDFRTVLEAARAAL